MVDCPICGRAVKEVNINRHIDSECQSHLDSSSSQGASVLPNNASQKPPAVSSFFQPATAKPSETTAGPSPRPDKHTSSPQAPDPTAQNESSATSSKRPLVDDTNPESSSNPPTKRGKRNNALQEAAPLAERMRPRTLDEVCGQELVGPTGILRGLIEHNRVPSMILWGGAGTGKTTIARVISTTVNSRFIEINSTSSGVVECKKLFAEARSELALTGRKTIIFCVSPPSTSSHITAFSPHALC
jgi:putative ATPase